jgi:hypothetical protein
VVVALPGPSDEDGEIVNKPAMQSCEVCMAGCQGGPKYRARLGTNERRALS